MVGRLNTGKMMCCGLGFLTMFFAYNTLQNLTTQLFEQLQFKELGFYTLAVIYITVCLTSLLGGPMVRVLGSRKLMALAAALCCIFVGSYVLLGLCANVPSMGSCVFCQHGFIVAMFVATSLVAGVSLGLVWLGQGSYLSECASENNGDVLQGVFWLIFQCSQVFGNLFASLVLTSHTAQLAFFCILLFVAMGAVAIFTCLRAAERATTPEMLTSFNHEAGQAESSAATGTTENVEVEITSANQRASIRSTFRALISRELAPFHLYCMYAGLVVTYFCGVLPLLIGDKLRAQGETNELVINRESAKVLIFFGLANSLGGLMFGQLSNRLGGRMAMALIFLTCFIAVVVTYAVQAYLDYGYVWLLTGVGWGLCDGSVNPIIMGTLANHFSGKAEPFSVFNFLKNMAAFGGFLVAAHLRNYPPYVFLSVVLAVTLVGCLTSFLFPFSSKSASPALLSIQSE